jgi:NADH-quinone oxidoreductase subunit C
MTVALDVDDVAARVLARFPGSVLEASENGLLIEGKSLLDVAGFLKTEPGLEMDYLANITSADYLKHFEVVYHLNSLTHNHGVALKIRVEGRTNPAVPSLTPLWRGADLQEREVYDLMGIRFEGHPNLKRVALWDGFNGHPLRKDWKADGKNVNVS